LRGSYNESNTAGIYIDNRKSTLITFCRCCWTHLFSAVTRQYTSKDFAVLLARKGRQSGEADQFLTTRWGLRRHKRLPIAQFQVTARNSLLLNGTDWRTGMPLLQTDSNLKVGNVSNCRCCITVGLVLRDYFEVLGLRASALLCLRFGAEVVLIGLGLSGSVAVLYTSQIWSLLHM
jgi:hypothetical protein